MIQRYKFGEMPAPRPLVKYWLVANEHSGHGFHDYGIIPLNIAIEKI